MCCFVVRLIAVAAMLPRPREGMRAACCPQVALSRDQVPEQVRQAAALLLKNYIRAHWQVCGLAEGIPSQGAASDLGPGTAAL